MGKGVRVSSHSDKKKKKIRIKGSSINDVFKEGGGGLGLVGFGKNRLNYG